MLVTLAKALEDQVFRAGGLFTIKAVLDKFLCLPLMRFVLPEGVNDPRNEEVGDKFIGAARDFFNDLLVSKGRRSDVDAIAFWAAAVALLPAALLSLLVQSKPLSRGWGCQSDGRTGGV